MSEEFNTIIAEVRNVVASQPRFAIAIDGRGGAGKSTLARGIVAAVPDLFHIEYDWFHLPASEVTPERRYDRARFRSEVLDPFLSGAMEMSYRRYNWGDLADSTDGLQKESLSVPEKCGVVIEGCETLHSELSGLYSVKIWLDVPKEQAFSQGLRRDIEQYGLDEAKVLPLWREWVKWEDESLKRDKRNRRADYVVRSDWNSIGRLPIS
jgi:uridine kinase